MKVYIDQTEFIDDLRQIIADTLCAGNGKNLAGEYADLRKVFRVRNVEIGKLAAPLNEKFGCNLREEDARKFQNLADIAQYLTENNFALQTLKLQLSGRAQKEAKR